MSQSHNYRKPTRKGGFVRTPSKPPVYGPGKLHICKPSSYIYILCKNDIGEYSNVYKCIFHYIVVSLLSKRSVQNTVNTQEAIALPGMEPHIHVQAYLYHLFLPVYNPFASQLQMKLIRSQIITIQFLYSSQTSATYSE